MLSECLLKLLNGEGSVDWLGHVVGRSADARGLGRRHGGPDALVQRPMGLAEMGGRLGSRATRRATSARHKPREQHLFLCGHAPSAGCDVHALLRGKTPRRSTAGRVGKCMGRDPASALRAVGRAGSGGQVLMLCSGWSMRSEDDPSTQSQQLRTWMGTHQVLTLFGFCIAPGHRRAGCGTTHGFHLLLPVSSPFLALSHSESTCDTLYLEVQGAFLRSQ